MSDYVPTEEEERAFSDPMDADRMPSATVDYWLYAAAIRARDAALRLAEEREAALAELWAWVEPKVDWACLAYLPHPDPKKAPHYAYDPRNKAIWEMRARVEAVLAAAPTAGEATGQPEGGFDGASR